MDRLVASSYGWPGPLERAEIPERLVALHDERVEKEERGEARRPWPELIVEQLAALQEVLAAEPVTAQRAAARFGGASAAQVRERLELLAGAGEAWVDGEGRYNRVEQPV